MRGFEYLAYSILSSMLLTVLILLPLAPVFASEETTVAAPEAEPVEAVSEPEAEEASPEENDLNEVVEMESAVFEIPGEDIVQDAAADPLEEENSSEPPVAEIDTEEGDVVPDDDTVSESAKALPPLDTAENATSSASEETENDVGSSDDVSSTTPSEAVEEETDATEEETAPPPSHEESENTPPPAIPASDDNETETPAEIDEEDEESAPVPARESTVAVNTVTNDENKFSFGKNECVSVGDGSFYCSDSETTPEVSGMDRVFSAVDEDGDREIYIEKDGELVSITDNTMDDDAPYFDEVSDTIVWHRLIDGRYQIVEYDLDEEEETVLTADRYNNMEPTRYGDLTVWQGWVGNDWEIMMEEDGEIQMITDNVFHDIAPHINGTYIVWQSFEDNTAWRVKIYDTLTKKIETIDDTDGASVENPRFVLVYDSKQGNGDVETKGYDLVSKQVIPLGAKPTPMPDELPDPDQTGEDRALVQPNTQPKPKDEGEAEPDDTPLGDGDSSGDDMLEEPADIVIPPLGAVGTTTESAVDEEADIVVPELQEETTPDIDDVIVPSPVVTPTASSTDHINEIVITPFVEPIETEVVQSG
jgi:chemotaxis protein histidine kinase CheA